ncbi:MAG: TetR/AcrR family transcriptional regulator [Hyphomicrobiaceae bacterium]
MNKPPLHTSDAVTTGGDAAGSPRRRIMAAARDLFYRHGIRAVGVEAIAEAASTNKMTLYRHFGSKDELIVAYVQDVADEADARWIEFENANPGNAAGQLEAWLQHVERVVNEIGDRGCALANAAVELKGSEHPALRIIEDYKARKRQRLVRLFVAAGYADPDLVADEVFLLFEGARISRQCCSGPECPAARLVQMLRSLLAGHARRTQA